MPRQLFVRYFSKRSGERIQRQRPSTGTACTVIGTTTWSLSTGSDSRTSNLAAWLTTHGWPEAAQEDLVLAVNEAVSNAVEHGYGVRPGAAGRAGLVEVAAERVADLCVEITVRDRGGWRPPSRLRAHRRHGIPIMKACAAHCVIDGTPSGTTVVLRSHPA